MKYFLIIKFDNYFRQSGMSKNFSRLFKAPRAWAYLILIGSPEQVRAMRTASLTS